MSSKSVKLGITLYNREYTINCGEGESQTETGRRSGSEKK